MHIQVKLEIKNLIAERGASFAARTQSNLLLPVAASPPFNLKAEENIESRV